MPNQRVPRPRRRNEVLQQVLISIDIIELELGWTISRAVVGTCYTAGIAMVIFTEQTCGN